MSNALRQEKTLTIDGHTYRIRQLGALEGRRIWLKLIRVLVEPLRSLASAGQLTEKAIADALAAAIENLDDATAEELYDVMGRNCQVRVIGAEGERWPDLNGVVFDNHFAGRYLAMTQWLGECLVFNFASFFDAGSIGKVNDLAKKLAGEGKPQSPPTSTGSSTAS